MSDQTRKIVENYIGRKLLNFNDVYIATENTDIQETVHHISGNNEDDRIENLHIFRTACAHTKYHCSLRTWVKGLMGATWEQRVEYLKTFPPKS